MSRSRWFLHPARLLVRCRGGMHPFPRSMSRLCRKDLGGYLEMAIIYQQRVHGEAAFYRSMLPVMCKNLPCNFLPLAKVSASFSPASKESATRGFCSAGIASLKLDAHANNKTSLQRILLEDIAQTQPQHRPITEMDVRSTPRRATSSALTFHQNSGAKYLHMQGRDSRPDCGTAYDRIAFAAGTGASSADEG